MEKYHETQQCEMLTEFIIENITVDMIIKIFSSDCHMMPSLTSIPVAFLSSTV